MSRLDALRGQLARLSGATAGALVARQVNAQLDDAIKEAQDPLAPLDADATALLINPLEITTAPRR
jgi:hypothetical protein